MAIALTPKDIVSRAQLDPPTARYVLDRARRLNIPAAEGQGRSRTFTVASAMRLAICARLVMHGVPLDLAEEMTEWCETRVRGTAGKKKAVDELFGGSVTNPWHIRIINGRFVQVLKDRPKRYELTFDDDDLRDFRDRKNVKPWDIEAHLPTVEWSLTALELTLQRGK